MGGLCHQHVADPQEVVHGRTMVFNFVVLYEMLLVFLIRRDYGVRLLTNALLWLAVTATFVLQGILMYTPMSSFFRIVPLSLIDLAQLAIGGVVFMGGYGGYRLMRRRFFQHPQTVH